MSRARKRRPGYDRSAAASALDGTALIERTRSALESAQSVVPGGVPSELQPIVALLPLIREVVAAVDASSARARTAESHLDDVLDHLRVVEVAMQSLSEARDDATRSLIEVRRAAGLGMEAIPPAGLTARIAELREQQALTEARCSRLRSTLETCYELMTCGRGLEEIEAPMLEAIRSALEP